VAGGHVGVESFNGSSSGGLAVLLVHVVGAGAGVISDPDAEVLDLQGMLLGDLEMGELLFPGNVAAPKNTYDIDGDNFTGSLLDLG
jgi:hypothetical protein